MPDILTFQLTKEARHNLAAAICLAGIYGYSVGTAIRNFDDCQDFTAEQLDIFNQLTFGNREEARKLVEQLI